MSKKQWILTTGMVLFIMLGFAFSWADSVQIKCLPEQPSDLAVPGDEIQSKAGVHRNVVLLEVFTATN